MHLLSWCSCVSRRSNSSNIGWYLGRFWSLCCFHNVQDKPVYDQWDWIPFVRVRRKNGWAFIPRMHKRKSPNQEPPTCLGIVVTRVRLTKKFAPILINHLTLNLGTPLVPIVKSTRSRATPLSFADIGMVKPLIVQLLLTFLKWPCMTTIIVTLLFWVFPLLSTILCGIPTVVPPTTLPKIHLSIMTNAHKKAHTHSKWEMVKVCLFLI